MRFIVTKDLARLTKLQDGLATIPVWKKSIGNIALRDVMENFEAGGRPKWKALSELTVLWRRKGSSEPLQDTGRLKAGVHIEDPGGNKVALSTSADSKYYAAAHQFGASIKVTKRSRNWFHWRDVHLKPGTTHITLPARPYMKLSKDGREEIKDYVKRKLVTA